MGKNWPPQHLAEATELERVEWLKLRLADVLIDRLERVPVGTGTQAFTDRILAVLNDLAATSFERAQDDAFELLLHELDQQVIRVMDTRLQSGIETAIDQMKRRLAADIPTRTG